MLRRFYSSRYGSSYYHQAQPIGKRISTADLQGYYNDLTGKADYNGPVDDKGIPILKWDGSFVHNPIAISQMALGLFDRWLLNGRPEDREKFLKLADWLMTARVAHGDGVVWQFSYDLRSSFRLQLPWTSAMAQGEGISVLSRAHKLTGDESYLSVAERAAIPLFIDVRDGGVGRQTEAGWWLEEYPTTPPSLVLNGCIFAAWGLYDLGLVLGDEWMKRFQEVAETIAATLSKFDAYGWSRYDLKPRLLPNIASPFYQRLHVEQLDAMWQLTGDERFAFYRDKWREGSKKPALESMAIAYKMVYRAAQYGSQLKGKVPIQGLRRTAPPVAF